MRHGLSGRRAGPVAWAVVAVLIAPGSRTLAAPGDEAIPRFVMAFADEILADEAIARHYDMVIWHHQPVLRQRLSELKRRKPGFRGLMYRELFCVLEQETDLEESVGHYAWLSAQRPEWFQRDGQGRRVEVPDYPGRWMMDLGHPGWQQFWIEQTLADVIEGGWDGVFVDDALTKVTAHGLPPLAGYPDDASLQQAVYAFLARISAAFRPMGKLVIANVSNSYEFRGLWEQWLEVTDGLNEEHFAGEGWTWGDGVAEAQLRALRAAQGMGKWALCLTYGSWADLNRMRTSLAAYLVSAGPQAYWSYKPAGPSSPPMWNPSWQVRLGPPLEEPQVSRGVWIRRFARGLVAVNPTSAPRTVPLGIGRLTLGPREGTILLDPAFASVTEDGFLARTGTDGHSR